MLKLYVAESDSHSAITLADEQPAPLLVTEFHEAEINNALQLKLRRKEIDESELARALAKLNANKADGYIISARVDWPAVWRKCRELSEHHAAATGCRTLDALHVASAIVLGASGFISFDIRQRALAERSGLRVLPSPR